ncbi:SRPBCC family protein [Blastomonas sp. UPD001]|uniref:SRPBCC family protein n=1 Tax=Blastomonas sp. UPD001 TaxID=2217673 RepID=UPI00130079AB|nr:SRPBCC family protein [Blastomonas sp. UPD001]
MLVWSLVAAATAGIGIATFATPHVVEYVETVVIKGRPKDIYDAIRYQRRLMEWSAWPPETGSACRVEGEDGAIGARTVFIDKHGKRFGHQEVTALTDSATVSFVLESKGPPHKPELHFHLSPMSDDTTLVIAHFRNDIAPPFNLVQRLFGIVRWTREMHRKDLDGLKRFVEKGETYLGNTAVAA